MACSRRRFIETVGGAAATAALSPFAARAAQAPHGLLVVDAQVHLCK